MNMNMFFVTAMTTILFYLVQNIAAQENNMYVDYFEDHDKNYDNKREQEENAEHQWSGEYEMVEAGSEERQIWKKERQDDAFHADLHDREGSVRQPDPTIGPKFKTRNKNHFYREEKDCLWDDEWLRGADAYVVCESFFRQKNPKMAYLGAPCDITIDGLGTFPGIGLECFWY